MLKEVVVKKCRVPITIQLQLCCLFPDGGDWGLDEKDMEASVATVHSMCEQLDADLIPLRERSETAGLVHDYLIRRRVGELDFLEVR